MLKAMPLKKQDKVVISKEKLQKANKILEQELQKINKKQD